MKISIKFRDLTLRVLLAAGLLGAFQTPGTNPPTKPTVTITATSDPNAAEVGTDTGTFTVTRTGQDLSVPLVVYFQTPGGTAQNGVDYQTLPTYVTIPANASTTNVTLTPILDLNSSEGNETVVLTLATNANYWVGWPGNATVTIADVPADSDNDGLPDAWEWWHFGNLAQNASDENGDYDGDGASNLLEYLNGSDPNTVVFSTLFANDYVNSNSVPGTVEVLLGFPAQMAVLINSTNFESATWNAFGSSVTAPLGTTDGVYEVWIGLKGRAANSDPSWKMDTIVRDTVPPLIILTNGIPGTNSRPMIQLQGYSPEPLADIRFDLTNALGSITNEQGFVSCQAYDTNSFQFTTNWFECLDLELTNDLNTVTLRVTDLAGNTTVTNLYYTLDYSGDTNPPIVELYWPPDGAQLCGTSFMLRGVVDDATAQVVAQIVQTNGTTNVVESVVERNGRFWAEELPLGDGTNYLTLTATDAAGNSSATNLSVVKSPVNLTINELPATDMNTKRISVSGTIDTTGYTVWVNGIKATLNGNDWSAGNVPLPNGGTALVQARAIPNSDNNGNGTGGGGGNNSSLSNPGNPASPSPTDTEAQADKAAAIQNVSCHFAWSATVVDGPNYGVHKSQYPWVREQEMHGTSRYIGHSPGFDSDSLSSYTWPPCVPEVGTCEEGTCTTVATFNGMTTTNSINGVEPPVISWEFCRVAVTRYYDSQNYPGVTVRETWTRITRSAIRLLTGGKAKPKQKNLFTISAAATDHVNLWEAGAYDRAVPSTELVVGSLGRLGNDGYLFKVLADDTTHDVTVRTPRKYYTYDVAAPKHKLFIKANDEILNPDFFLFSLMPQFCVGQKVTFTSDWDQTPPGIASNAYDWVISAKFVNHSWQHQGEIPNPQGPPTVYYYGSVNYDIDPDLLKTENPFAWWVSGGDKNAKLKVTVCFNNGQSVELKEKGKFGMFRPQTIDFYTATNTRIVLDTNDLSEIWLGIADKDSTAGEMKWTATVAYDLTRYPGTVSYVQLINRAVSYDSGFVCITKHDGGTDGGDWLDGSDPYGSVQWVSGDNYRIEQALTDTPGISGSFCTFADVTDSFTDYIRFQPNGGIPVTIGRVGWGWHGRAAKSNGVWSLTISHLTNATFRQDDNFPPWEVVYHNSPEYQ